jgi:uncharacterized membrane protein YdjX (TVP38/TMEM64 family)
MPRRLGLVVLFIALVVLAWTLPIGAWVVTLVEWAQSRPVAGPIAYIFFVTLATVIFLPGSAAMMIGGFVFGFGPGLLLAAIAIPLGAQAAFEFARWAVRPWARQKIADNNRIAAIEAALQEQAFTVIVLTRLSLVVPFNALNYAYGATAVKATKYFGATAIGMLPAVGLYVYLGTLARDLSQILSGDAAPSELRYWILGGGITAIVIATAVIHRAASRALQSHLQQSPEVEK